MVKPIDNFNMKTEQEFDKAFDMCKQIFICKLTDYGTAWRILRPSSITDQLLIKAKRIRSLEEKKVSKVGEGIVPEFIGIVNYSIIGLIQLKLGVSNNANMEADKALELYNKYGKEIKTLMLAKNHDYDEAWRLMRCSSYTDLILTKIYRTKQIEENDGHTIISEGIAANYMDMANYAIFALIKLTIEE